MSAAGTGENFQWIDATEIVGYDETNGESVLSFLLIGIFTHQR
jgi:hypothetical protein